MADDSGATLADVMPEEATGTAPPAEIVEAPVYEKVVDDQGRSYATGKRKNAVARVWVKPGNGQIEVNGRDGNIYFSRPTLQMIIRQPFDVAERKDQFDVYCTVKGGGLSGQAGAIKHGISRALLEANEELRPQLKKEGFLTRDARAVERKKYGRPGARKSYQFSKR